MSNAEFLKVHHYRRVPGTTEVKLLRKTPYKAFLAQGQPTCFIRAGQAFSESGDLYEGGIPGFAREQLEKMSAKNLEKLGFKKEDFPNAEAKPEEAPKAAEGEEVETSEETEQQAEPIEPESVQGLNSPLAERRARRGHRT